jgi:anti-sigma B factor antagonist
MSESGARGFEPPPFAIRSETAESASIVSVQGELDLATTPQLENALLAAESDRGTDVVLDLCEVEFIDSTALRALILSAERLNEQGNELQVACGPGAVRRLFELTVLTAKFGMHENREDAVAALASP